MKKITLLSLCLIFLFTAKGICSTIDTLVVTVYGNPSSSQQFNETGYTINGEVFEYSGWTGQPSIHIAIIDSSTCIPVSNCNRNFGQVNIFNDPDGDCIVDLNTYYTSRSRYENYFIYRSGETAAMQAMAHVLDSVGVGHFIIAYTWFPNTYSTMDTSFRNVFQRLGSTLIASIPDTVPFIFICRKGDQGSIHEIIGTQSNSLITMSMTYQCSATGISDLNDVAYHVYPNPVKDKLHVDFQNVDFKEGEIKIYDAIGNLVSTERPMESQVTLNTGKLSPGIYFIRIESTDRISTVRFCKTE